MNSIEKITYLASAAGLDNRLYVDGNGNLVANKKQGSLNGLRELIKSAYEGASDKQQMAIVQHAVCRIESYLDEKRQRVDHFILRWFFRSGIQRIVDFKNGLKEIRSANQLNIADQQYDDEQTARIEEIARINLFSTFKTDFPARLFSPGRPANIEVASLIAEARVIEVISKRIFAFVRDDYTYGYFMGHFIRGSHMIFEEQTGQTPLATQLQKAMDEAKKQHYRDKKIESSHYKLDPAKNRQGHHRISGMALFPEILICPEEELELNTEGEVIKGKVASKDAAKSQIRTYTAIQNENFSDGPVRGTILPPGKQEGEDYWRTTLPFYLTRTLPHRIVDFVEYALRKNLGCKMVNVAKHGNGVGDEQAIVIG